MNLKKCCFELIPNLTKIGPHGEVLGRASDVWGMLGFSCKEKLFMIDHGEGWDQIRVLRAIRDSIRENRLFKLQTIINGDVVWKLKKACECGLEIDFIVDKNGNILTNHPSYKWVRNNIGKICDR